MAVTAVRSAGKDGAGRGEGGGGSVNLVKRTENELARDFTPDNSSDIFSAIGSNAEISDFNASTKSDELLDITVERARKEHFLISSIIATAKPLRMPINSRELT